jgi:hypothetical protein
MLQIIGGKTVYVVKFDTMPELPITGLTEQEAGYKNILSKIIGNLNGLLVNMPRTSAYANALTNAIATGVITEPGKYGIHLVTGTANYEIYKIVE